MCNLCRLNIAKKDLPLPPPLNTAWLETKKIIDAFTFPITQDLLARNYTLQLTWRRSTQTSTRKLESRHLLGSAASNTSSVQWTKPIICFTFTEWLEEEIYTQKSATQWGENLFCQKTRSLPNLHISLMNQPPLLRGGTVWALFTLFCCTRWNSGGSIRLTYSCQVIL